MNEEEKKAIEIIKGLSVYYDDYSLLDEEEIKENESVNKSIELILNLIENLIAENKELKADNYELNNRITDLLENIPVQKVKDKIRKNEEIIDISNDGDLIHELCQKNKVYEELLEEMKEGENNV